MSAAMSYYLSVILISRLLFLFRDGVLPKKQWGMMVGIQVVGALVFGLRVATIIMVVLVVLVNFFFYRWARRTKKVNLARLFSLAALVVVGSVFFSERLALHFHPAGLQVLQVLSEYSTLFALPVGWDARQVSIQFFGLLLVTNEVNILIRVLFEQFKLVPNLGKPVEKNLVQVVNRREYNAGRVIGILERVFVYYFVLNGQLTAIGFILAAKSFARFKDLDQREFAEYVLIGTLLSALLAMLVGGLVLGMLFS